METNERDSIVPSLPRRRLWAKRLLLLLGICAVGSASFWAGRETFPAVSSGIEPSGPIVYAVQQATLSQSFSYAVEVQPQVLPAFLMTLEGTVTSVAIPVTVPTQVLPGRILYTVDLIPVVVALGPIPEFRDMTVGVVGPDVLQLEQFLSDSAYLLRPPSDRFDQKTRQALIKWQRSVGAPETGIAVRGSFEFFPSLPIKLILAGDLRPGQSVSTSNSFVSIVQGDPTFQLTISTDQVQRIPDDAYIVIEVTPSFKLRARLSDSRTDDNGQVRIDLIDASGRELVCGSPCDSLPVDATSSTLTAEVEVVPKTSGPTVPVSGLSEVGPGEYSVTRADGQRVAVKVRAIVGGRAVVEGIAVGDEIILNLATVA